MKQLDHNSIRDTEALVERAELKETWEKLLDSASGGLEAKLRKWYSSTPELKEVRSSMKRKAEENGSMVRLQKQKRLSSNYYKTELDLLEEYRPLHIEGIERCREMLGQYLTVDKTHILWSDSRKYLNSEDRVFDYCRNH
jgi:hypothetical protein